MPLGQCNQPNREAANGRRSAAQHVSTVETPFSCRRLFSSFSFDMRMRSHGPKFGPLSIGLQGALILGLSFIMKSCEEKGSELRHSRFVSLL